MDGVRNYDASGRLVSTAATCSAIDVSSLVPGIYVIELEVEKAVWRDRFVRE